MAIAIRVQNLSKQFRIGGKQASYRTMRDIMAQAAGAPIRRMRGVLRGEAAAASDLSETFWALRDVSFDVKPGEVVGVIGRNGAGKSTLLKVLSRITEPTKGRLWIKGRIAALLEVGTGFHPELTGRENVYLNGAILGMTRTEIERQFDEIVSFAEVEKFIDTPVKHYSSGMRLRLGFAVAAHLQPEILIVDEVLAVGDAQFQKKCLGKMSDVANQGRTVLFVSHNMIAVRSLCNRAVWLNAGTVVADGPTHEVVTSYLNENVSLSTERVWDDPETAPGNDRVRLRRVGVNPADGSSEPITVSTPIVVEFEYWNLKPDVCLNLSIAVYDEQHMLIFNTASVYDLEWQNRPFPVGLFRSSFLIPGDLLNDGIHEIEVLLVKDQVNIVFMLPGALMFQVDESPMRYQGYSWHGKWPGAVRPRFTWSTQMLDEKVQTTISAPQYELIESGGNNVS